MYVQEINKSLLALKHDHPARQFLEAFIACRMNCVGKELDGVDQEWFSTLENRRRRFSSVVYEHLAFDVELDGWLKDAQTMTESERQSLGAIRHLDTLVNECLDAAIAENNPPVVSMCREVLDMLGKWKVAIDVRLDYKASE
jgi:hypothetical protein